VTSLSVQIDEATREQLRRQAESMNRAPEEVAGEILDRWCRLLREHQEDLEALDEEASMLRRIFSRPD
jgi:acyl-CoA reductase-like NAD-dependent aldehyde dehydrogenase